jgi:hypothetical protein
MSDIKGIPYFQARFDKKGAADPTNAINLPAGTTDVFVISHGWRNDENDANTIYTDFFTNFADPKVVDPAKLAGRECAIIGVFWPSRNFDALIAAQGAVTAGNAAAIGNAVSDPESQKKLVAQLEALKAPGLFDEPAQLQALTDAQALVPNLDTKATARAAFINHLRSLMDHTAAGKEDASDIFLKMDPNDLFNRLNIPANSVDKTIPKTGQAMALSPTAAVAATGHAAGLLDIFKGAAASASNAASYLSYFMMKERAGVVGTNGVAPLIDALAPKVQRIHLIGHSFGGRVVTAAALASSNEKIQSMALLQAAFSHNGFSPPELMNGLFRPVIDRQRIKGPIIATHTKNDTAVGIAYPLASRVSGTVAAALGDAHDKYGGVGRNGAQQMKAGEVVTATLLPVGGAYQFTAGKIHNLLADAFVKNHGDITGAEVVTAFSQAIV